MDERLAGNYIFSIEKLHDQGRNIEAAKAICSPQFWYQFSSNPDLIRLQKTISRYHQLDLITLEGQVSQFIALFKEKAGVKKNIFIVHGWDNELKLDAKNYFQNTLGYECIILHERDGEGDTIINKFEKYAKECAAAIVLLSEVDAKDMESFDDPNALKRPRPNVLFELGYFFSLLGRKGVLILKKGNVEIHSDILGIEYIDVSAGIVSAGEKIRTRLAWLPT